MMIIEVFTIENIFLSGEFDNYKRSSVTEARQSINESLYHYAQRKITIFISHKHDDLEDLKGIIGFLERTYNVKCYIDSRDPAMPKITSGETATKIKERIKQCDKFILLASNGAIDSKWCNWELGYGDAQKFKDHIALFPFKRENENYDGYEYMEIYPHIVKYSGYETYTNGEKVKAGYYVCTIGKDRINLITPLESWLEE